MGEVDEYNYWDGLDKGVAGIVSPAPISPRLLLAPATTMHLRNFALLLTFTLSAVVLASPLPAPPHPENL